MILNALFMQFQIFVKIVFTVFQIAAPFLSQKFFMPCTVSMTISFTMGHTFFAISHTRVKIFLTTAHTFLSADFILESIFSPFLSHHSFIASTAFRIKDFIFSHIFVTAFLKSSLVFQKYTSIPATAAIAMMIKPTFENNTEATFAIVPMLDITLPSTISNGPIAAASNAMTTTFFLVPIDKPIIFAVNGLMYFVISCRIIGISTSPNIIAISSSSDFKIFH